jgi:hypothetical protein
MSGPGSGRAIHGPYPHVVAAKPRRARPPDSHKRDDGGPRIEIRGLRQCCIVAPERAGRSAAPTHQWKSTAQAKAMKPNSRPTPIASNPVICTAARRPVSSAVSPEATLTTAVEPATASARAVGRSGALPMASTALAIKATHPAHAIASPKAGMAHETGVARRRFACMSPVVVRRGIVYERSIVGRLAVVDERHLCSACRRGTTEASCSPGSGPYV